MVEVKRDDPAFKNKMAIKQCCGCSSFVGRIHKEQMVSLGSGCEGGNLPLHEVRIFMNTKRYNDGNPVRGINRISVIVPFVLVCLSSPLVHKTPHPGCE